MTSQPTPKARSVTISARVTEDELMFLRLEALTHHTSVSGMISALCAKRFPLKAHPATAVLGQFIATLQMLRDSKVADPDLLRALRELIEQLVPIVMGELK